MTWLHDLTVELWTDLLFYFFMILGKKKYESK
jgi:hypothetical protein